MRLEFYAPDLCNTWKMFVFGVQKCLGTWSCLPSSRPR